MRCPTHDMEMTRSMTRYGPRFDCLADGCCEMVAWGDDGHPADAATRKARIEAHDAFDKLWRGKAKGTRTTVYRWLAGKLGINRDDCHIQQFDIATCRRVIELSTEERT